VMTTRNGKRSTQSLGGVFTKRLVSGRSAVGCGGSAGYAGR